MMMIKKTQIQANTFVDRDLAYSGFYRLGVSSTLSVEPRWWPRRNVRENNRIFVENHWWEPEIEITSEPSGRVFQLRRRAWTLSPINFSAPWCRCCSERLQHRPARRRPCLSRWRRTSDRQGDRHPSREDPVWL